MDLLLITTSRRTSNRVRSFVRDLWSVFPGASRFNRGSMNLAELAAKVRTTSAKAALVVTMFKGNVGDLQFFDSEGTQFLTIRTESAALKREVHPNAPRINSIRSIQVSASQNQELLKFANILSEITETPFEVRAEVESTSPIHSNSVIISLDELPSGKIVWSHYHSADGEEIGPRIRIKSFV